MCQCGGVNLEMGACGTALVLEGDLSANSCFCWFVVVVVVFNLPKMILL